jgi:hypothetical protein
MKGEKADWKDQGYSTGRILEGGGGCWWVFPCMKEFIYKECEHAKEGVLVGDRVRTTSEHTKGKEMPQLGAMAGGI